MDQRSPREILASLIAERGDNYGALSRLIGRNAAYIQQFIKRGTPRKLDEKDRRVLARYFGVDEALLGAEEGAGVEHRSIGKLGTKPRKIIKIADVPKLEIEVSAGMGTIVDGEYTAASVGFDLHWLRNLGLNPENLSIIDVKGESMAPTLSNGDTVMVDMSDRAERLRDGIYVLRLDDALMVKRVSLSPRRERRALTISSDNPHFPTWEDIDPALVDIVGRVVWASRILT
ncbi:MAG: S24 family peptidase [Sphingobium sp.]|nr:S24 family peptidase [Sphingobium sp.]MCP5398761.1 S24 family peptidase [Sphingomonas sp.]